MKWSRMDPFGTAFGFRPALSLAAMIKSEAPCPSHSSSRIALIDAPPRASEKAISADVLRANSALPNNPNRSGPPVPKLDEHFPLSASDFRAI
jgi:hypothetical protein